MTKRIFITGIAGQDGSYLSELLAKTDCQIFGLTNQKYSNNPVSLEAIKKLGGKVILIDGDITDTNLLGKIFKDIKPHEIYNLAAISSVSESFKIPERVMEVNFRAFKRLVDEALIVVPKVRIYQASSSEMFGKAFAPQNEKTDFMPVSPYGESKLRAYREVVLEYRKKKGIHICSGIMFNHESPRRGESFVTQKIVTDLSKVKLRLLAHLELGNLDVERDWGFAGDYVKAMYLILNHDKADDYVIATGKSHTVRDFVNETAKNLGLKIKWRGQGEREEAIDNKGKILVKVNPIFYRSKELNATIGDSAKARKILGWKPRVNFEGLVKMMVKAAFERYV
ncbi:MAG: GDPmannose 4,6-dehydratase [Parcubacteria group bacterium Gr01-1014_73]|nr:MAG: GDPmannose 4,6-dehydratase [Parcubacteria group bacterium Gr01-1014_73]